MSCVTEKSKMVWTYGEGGHIKLTIDNPSIKDKEKKCSLISMEFQHLHSKEKNTLSQLSLRDLKVELLNVQKCKQTMAFVAGNIGFQLAKDAILSSGEANQIMENARLHRNICNLEETDIQEVLLNKLYDAFDEEKHPKKKKVIEMSIFELEDLFGVEEKRND